MNSVKHSALYYHYDVKNIFFANYEYLKRLKTFQMVSFVSDFTKIAQSLCDEEQKQNFGFVRFVRYFTWNLCNGHEKYGHIRFQ